MDSQATSSSWKPAPVIVTKGDIGKEKRALLLTKFADPKVDRRVWELVVQGKTPSFFTAPANETAEARDIREEKINDFKSHDTALYGRIHSALDANLQTKFQARSDYHALLAQSSTVPLLETLESMVAGGTTAHKGETGYKLHKIMANRKQKTGDLNHLQLMSRDRNSKNKAWQHRLGLGVDAILPSDDQLTALGAATEAQKQQMRAELINFGKRLFELDDCVLLLHSLDSETHSSVLLRYKTAAAESNALPKELVSWNPLVDLLDKMADKRSTSAESDDEVVANAATLKPSGNQLKRLHDSNLAGNKKKKKTQQQHPLQHPQQRPNHFGRDCQLCTSMNVSQHLRRHNMEHCPLQKMMDKAADNAVRQKRMNETRTNNNNKLRNKALRAEGELLGGDDAFDGVQTEHPDLAAAYD